MNGYIDLVFENFPCPEGARFVEAEDASGKSIDLGNWVKRDDGYCVLRIPDHAACIKRLEAERDEHAEGGYVDGVSDALNCVSSDEDRREIRQKLQGWTTCSSCDGTGKNTAPNEADIAHALLISLGGHTNQTPLLCKTCYGEGIVEPEGV